MGELFNSFYPQGSQGSKVSQTSSSSGLFNQFYPQQQVQVSQPQQKQSLRQRVQPVVEQAKPIAQNVFGKITGFIKSIPETFKETKKEPKVFTRGLATATSKTVPTLTQPVAWIQKGVASATGTTIPEKWDISKQAKSFNKLVDFNAEPYKMEAPKAFMAGEIIGGIQKFAFEWTIARGTVGKAIELPAAKIFGPKLGFLAPKIATISTGAGLGQLEYDKETDGSRIDRLKSDVIVFGLFEAAPILAKGISKATNKLVSSTFKNVSNKLKSGKSVEIASLENTTQPVKEAIIKDTGKNPQALLVNNVSKASEKELKAVSLPKVAQGRFYDVKKYYHVTSAENAKAIQQGGFKPQIGERSLGVANAKGTWLYDDPTATSEFGKNFTRVGKTPVTLETKVNGKIYDGTNADKSIRALVEDKKLISKLKAEGYVGIKGDELGTSATFIFEPKAISVVPQLGYKELQKNQSLLQSRLQNPQTSQGIIPNSVAQPPLGDVKAKVKPKEVKVPREQLPVGEGKEKVSRLEARMKGVLRKATPEEIDQLGLSTYKVGKEPERLAKAAKFVLENPEDAMKVIEGKIPPPLGNQSNDIFVAMTQSPNLTSELATKLASFKSTAMGQNIGILKNIDPNNPVAIASDIYKIKEKVFQQRYGGKTPTEVIKKFVEKGKVKMQPPKLSDWGSVIKSVRC